MLPAIGVSRDLIDGATTSADVDRAKPAPDLFRTAMEKYGLDPARTVVVGDTVWDVESAHGSDLRCVTFTCGGIPRCQLEAAGAADLLEPWDSSLLAGLS